ncbi:MAG: hypothetical protein HFE63_09895 [Clostridiales bacterium]|nr:hypothetical protein [Clostridiales bacterium]
MTKILKISFCTLFFATCLFFSLAMMIPGASNIAESDVEKPQIFLDGYINQDFGNEYEEYFSKAFAFRSNVVGAWSAIRTSIFAEGNDQVIIGKHDFLYFADTLDDYTGSAPMTDDEVKATAASLHALSEYAEGRGAKLLFVCAPNKNHIYPEYMPARYLQSDEPSNLDRLYAALDECGVAYCDLREPLLDAKSERLIYHRRDTHWNQDGAAIAMNVISSALDFDMPNLADITRTEPRDLVGDLDTLLYPDKTLYDENPTYDLSELYIYTSAYSTPMDMQISARGSGRGKALIFRDSFANALIPFLASSFQETRFERAIPYRIDLLDEFSADYVIVEIAERNLRNLINSDSRIK